MMFNQYPYLNLNDLNLDYILAQIKTMMNEVTNFVSINAIKYADPIQWDITRQYEKNTVVIDPVTGTAYISVAPVPAGVALTRPEYWTVVFDLGSFVTRAAQNFTSRYEQETTLTATFPTNTGEWLVWGDVLYKAKTNITAGDTYVVDGNIEHFTIEDLYNTYLNTIATILAMVGDLADLNTSDKDSIVDAINEVVANIGDLTTLLTSDKTDVVSAINEVVRNVTDIQLTLDDIANVKNYGAKGDGTTDDTAAIQIAIDSGKSIIYFPAGVYQVTQLEVDNLAPHIPVFVGSYWFNSQLRCTVTGNASIHIAEGNGAKILNLGFRQNSGVTASGVVFENDTTIRIEDCLFYDVSNGISARSTTSGTIIRGCMFTGNNVTSHIYAVDMNDFVIDSCQFGRISKLTYDNQYLAILSSCRNGTIINCMFWEGIHGLYMYNCDYDRVQNCRFEACGHEGIDLETTDNVIIQGCWINDNNSLNVNAPHMKLRGSTHVIIDSCIFQDWALHTSPAVHCIDITDVSSYITISNCDADNYVGDMLYIDAQSAGLNILSDAIMSSGLTAGDCCLAYFYLRAASAPLSGDVTITVDGTQILNETLDTSQWAQQILLTKDIAYNSIVDVAFSDTSRTDYNWRIVYVLK